MAVTYATLVFDAGAAFAGIHGVLEPSEYVHDTTTGQLVMSKPIAFQLDTNGYAEVQVPHTIGVSTYTDSFTLTVTWAVPSGAQTPGYKEFVIQAAATTVNFADVPHTPDGTGPSGGGFGDGQTGYVYCGFGNYDLGIVMGQGADWQAGQTEVDSRGLWYQPLLPIEYDHADIPLGEGPYMPDQPNRTYSDTAGTVAGAEITVARAGWYKLTIAAAVNTTDKATFPYVRFTADSTTVNAWIETGTSGQFTQSMSTVTYLNGPMRLRVAPPLGVDVTGKDGQVTIKRVTMTMMPLFAV